MSSSAGLSICLPKYLSIYIYSTYLGPVCLSILDRYVFFITQSIYLHLSMNYLSRSCPFSGPRLSIYLEPDRTIYLFNYKSIYLGSSCFLAGTGRWLWARMFQSEVYMQQRIARGVVLDLLLLGSFTRLSCTIVKWNL